MNDPATVQLHPTTEELGAMLNRHMAGTRLSRETREAQARAFVAKHAPWLLDAVLPPGVERSVFSTHATQGLDHPARAGIHQVIDHRATVKGKRAIIQEFVDPPAGRLIIVAFYI